MFSSHTPPHTLFDWVIAMGTNEFFAWLVLTLGYLYLRPEGRGLNSTESGWVVSMQTLSAFCANLIRYSWYKSTCCLPMILPQVLTIFPNLFLWVIFECPYQHTIQQERILSIKDIKKRQHFINIKIIKFSKKI